jgi:hypothetical protein
MTREERARGFVLVAVLLLIAGSLSLASGLATVASAAHQADLRDGGAGCSSGANCTVEAPPNEQPALRAGELAVAFGAVLLVVALVLGVLGWSGGFGRRPLPPNRP